MLQGHCWKLQALLCMLGRTAEALRANAYKCSLCLQIISNHHIRAIKPLLYKSQHAVRPTHQVA